jgi:hypothetical protein
MHPQFYDRQGRRIPEHEARDRNGIIRDGVVMRTRMMARDGAPHLRFTDARQFWDRHKDTLLVTDARALGGTEGNKPGFRILDSPLNRQAVNDAYRAYEDDLTNAWRNNPPTGSGSSGPRGVVSSNPPPGAYPYSPAAEGAACTVDGRSGRLVRQGNWLVCNPTTDARASDGEMTCPDCDGDGEIDGEECPRCEGSGEIDTDDDEYEKSEDRRSVDRRRMTIDEMRVNHARNMNRIYDQITHELQNAWRQGK